MEERVRKRVLYIDDLDDDMPTLPRLCVRKPPAAPEPPPSIGEIQQTWKLRQVQIFRYLMRKAADVRRRYG